jgi:hypothetical protein
MRLPSMKWAALALATAVLACTGEPLTAPETAPGGVQPEALTLTALTSRFPSCMPLPAATSEATIGSSGGTLSAGGHTFRIPAGALKIPVTITMEAPSDTIPSVKFSPAGLVFDPYHLPTLTLNYRNCAVPMGAVPKIVFTTDRFTVLENEGGWNYNGVVSAPIRHFSRYAIYY